MDASLSIRSPECRLLATDSSASRLDLNDVSMQFRSAATASVADPVCCSAGFSNECKDETGPEHASASKTSRIPWDSFHSQTKELKLSQHNLEKKLLALVEAEIS
ncbi:hypothetical protein SDJN02_18372, partial [Cucurbita argyrosperma subsp. argyrosperma]